MKLTRLEVKCDDVLNLPEPKEQEIIFIVNSVTEKQYFLQATNFYDVILWSFRPQTLN